MAEKDWYRLSSSCPNSSTSVGYDNWLHTPCTSITQFSVAVFSLIAAIVVVTTCSSISALWKRSYPLAITNLHWMLFFTLSALQAGLHSAVYAYDPKSERLLHANFIGGSILRSLQILLAALAFQHERVYRRIAIAQANRSFHQSTCFEKCHLVNGLSCFLVLAEIIVIVLVETKFSEPALVWASQGVLLAQRLTVLCTVGAILCRHDNEDSPSISAQIAVVCAMVLTSPADLTPYTLESYEVGHCWLYFGTLYDLFLMLHLLAMVLLLVYIRLEYVRLLPVCRYSLISSIQGQLDFHSH